MWEHARALSVREFRDNFEEEDSRGRRYECCCDLAQVFRSCRVKIKQPARRTLKPQDAECKKSEFIYIFEKQKNHKQSSDPISPPLYNIPTAVTAVFVCLDGAKEHNLVRYLMLNCSLSVTFLFVHSSLFFFYCICKLFFLIPSVSAQLILNVYIFLFSFPIQIFLICIFCSF